MSNSRKIRKQYVEPYAEYVGEEMKPFVALLPKEERPQETSTTSLSQTELNTTAAKRKKPFWKRITAFFS
jgi:hypothetical protein